MDGLNKWGKFWMDANPGMTADYEAQAKLYWGDRTGKIINEINTQAQAFANTPQGNENEYAILHKSDYGLTDYVMLLVCHYNASITFAEFTVTNHGRYKEIERPDYEKLKAYQVGLFIYTFTLEGDYIGHYTA